VPVQYSAKIQESLARYSASKQVRHYRVSKGDTLGEIAEQFKVSTRELALINGLDNEQQTLRTGMRLAIPPAPQAENNWASLM